CPRISSILKNIFRRFTFHLPGSMIEWCMWKREGQTQKRNFQGILRKNQCCFGMGLVFYTAEHQGRQNDGILRRSGK
ncbi:hypothetical protein, partial [Clostridium phoceensis]|uniref:hypothetical protein n=1 Tax=Clostridium phoceensis TaxID=1650661 RepID=UPI00265FCB86